MQKVGGTFPENIQTAVDIGMNDGSITCAIPTSSNARTGEDWLLRTICLIGGNGVAVQKARFAGLTLFLHDNLDPDQLSLVGQLVNETSMGKLHKLLIVFPAHVRFLLPEQIFANAQCADPLAHRPDQ